MYGIIFKTLSCLKLQGLDFLGKFKIIAKFLLFQVVIKVSLICILVIGLQKILASIYHLCIMSLVALCTPTCLLLNSEYFFCKNLKLQFLVF